MELLVKSRGPKTLVRLKQTGSEHGRKTPESAVRGR